MRRRLRSRDSFPKSHREPKPVRIRFEEASSMMKLMMKLYVIPPAFGLRNTGPFDLKCEMALRHLEREFKLVPSAPRTAPKGKLPYLDDAGVDTSVSRPQDERCALPTPERSAERGRHRVLAARRRTSLLGGGRQPLARRRVVARHCPRLLWVHAVPGASHCAHGRAKRGP